METRIDYSAVVAALRAEKEQLEQTLAQYDAAIAAIQRLQWRASLGEVVARAATGAKETVAQLRAELHASVSPYKGMAVARAAVAHLRAVNVPQTTRQIADALQRGGLDTRSHNFPNTVYARLKRAMDEGRYFVRENDKWGLQEWASRQVDDPWTLDSSVADGPEEALARSARAGVEARGRDR